MIEQVDFSPTLVEKVAGIIRQETETGRDPYGWQKTFEDSIPNQISRKKSGKPILSDDAVKSLQERFQTVFLHCTDIVESKPSSDPLIINSSPQAAIIFQAPQEQGGNKNNGGSGNHQRHLDGFDQLPSKQQRMYLRRKAARTKGHETGKDDRSRVKNRLRNC